MIRLLAILIGAALFAGGIAWIADRQGELFFTLDAYEIRMGAGMAIGLLLLFAVLIAVLSRILAAILSGPGMIGEWLAARRARRANEALSRGLVAAAAGDMIEVRRQSRKIRGLLAEHPLTLLLAAQSAQLEGHEEGQRAAYLSMLEYSETEFLGLRGLFMLATRAGNDEEATGYAARAHELKPRARWAINALFDLKSARGEWSVAKDILEEAARAKLIDSGLARRRRAVLLAAEAVQADRRGESEKALALALEALTLSPGLAPAAALAAKKLALAGKLWRAQGVIEDAWSQSPHPDLAFVYGALKPEETAEARAGRLASLAHLNRGHFESRILEAEEAVHRKDWVEARRLLAPMAHGFASARVCALMAEIEEGDTADATTAHEWLGRAARAPRDAIWRCGNCGWASAQWAPVCADCGGFDTLSWSAPTADMLERYADEHSIAAEGALFSPEHLPSSSFARPSSSPAERQRARTRRLKDAEEAGGFVVLPRPPDDPGPEGDLELEEEDAP